MDNPLLLNQNGINFLESGVAAGVDNPISSWGSIFFDFDNNAHQDLYVNNMFQANTLFLNSGTFPCTENAAQANLQANGGASFSAAVADVDGDGDIDLLVNNLQNNVQLFINHEGDNRRWIKYRLIGSGTNTWAIGANIDTTIGESHQFREIYAGGNGYLGQNELTIHIGVDDALVVDEAVVNWPGGQITRTLTNIPTNQTWSIYPPERLGDADGDGTVGINDFYVFEFFFNGPIEPGCEMMDFDGNSFIDIIDFEGFLAVYSFDLLDCDADGEIDLTEILLDPDLDMDQTGILDTCENLGDLDGSGFVNTSDLLALFASWGMCDSCSQCPADLDDNCSVGTSDLLILFSNWGQTF
ncbi:MAG: CRTAC1 family protein [Planctomycetes bacterium]|nr:CRTAC1 family protein [Planctomycetota bacterium]